MSRILLGQSYYLRFDPKLEAAMQPYPPLGTLYAASYLRSRGFEVSLFDAMLAGSTEEWKEALDHHRPRYAVLYEDNFNYLSKMCLLRMREAAFQMIALARSRGCKIIVSGADATDRAEIYLKNGADYVIQGEGEVTLGQLLECLEDREGGSPEGLLGLVWNDAKGRARRNPARPPLADIDLLPHPAWDLVQVPRYRRRWLARHGYFSMNMVTTRGCPYHCNWCAKPIWGRHYSSRSPENVIAELAWLKATFQPGHIWFADDIFGLKPGWIEHFGRLAREQGAGIPFKCQMRADLVQPAVAAGLRNAGCRTVWLGAESGSQKILDAMEKGTTVEQIREARRQLGAAGIQVGLFLQFGYPGENRADIDLTLQMIRDLAPDDIGISVSYPLPGTGFYEQVCSQLGGKQNWRDSDDLAMLYHGPFSGEFYRTLYNAVHAEFRMRKALKKLDAQGDRQQSGLAGTLRTAVSIPKNWLAWHGQTWRLRRIHARPEISIPSPERP